MAFNLKEYILFRTEIKRELFNEEVDTNFQMVSNPWVATRRYEKGNIVYHPVTLENVTGDISATGDDTEHLTWWRANKRTTLGVFNLTQWDIIGGVAGFTDITVAAAKGYGKILANWEYPPTQVWDANFDGILEAVGPTDTIKFAAGPGISIAWNDADEAMLITNTGNLGEINNGDNIGTASAQSVYDGMTGGYPQNDIKLKGFRSTNVGNPALTVSTVVTLTDKDIVYDFDEGQITLAHISNGSPELDELSDITYVGLAKGDILYWNGTTWQNQPASAGMGNTIYTQNDTINNSTRTVSLNNSPGNLSFRSLVNSNYGLFIDNGGDKFVFGENATVASGEQFRFNTNVNDTGLNYSLSVRNSDAKGAAATYYQSAGSSSGFIHGINTTAQGGNFTIAPGSNFNGTGSGDAFTIDQNRNIWVYEWSGAALGITDVNNENMIPMANAKGSVTPLQTGKTKISKGLIYVNDGTDGIGAGSNGNQLLINTRVTDLAGNGVTEKAGLYVANAPNLDQEKFYGIKSKTTGIPNVANPAQVIYGIQTEVYDRTATPVKAVEASIGQISYQGTNAASAIQPVTMGSLIKVYDTPTNLANGAGVVAWNHAGHEIDFGFISVNAPLSGGGRNVGIYSDVVNQFSSIADVMFGNAEYQELSDWAGLFVGCVAIKKGGLAIEPQSANPLCGGYQNILWVNETNEHLYFGDVDLTTGGGSTGGAGCADEGLSVDPLSGCIEWGELVGGTGAPLLTDREIEFGDFSMNFKSASGASWDFWLGGKQNGSGTGPLLNPDNISSLFHIDNNSQGYSVNEMNATGLLMSGDKLIIDPGAENERAVSVPSVLGWHAKFNAELLHTPTYYTEDQDDVLYPKSGIENLCNVLGRQRYDGYIFAKGTLSNPSVKGISSLYTGNTVNGQPGGGEGGIVNLFGRSQSETGTKGIFDGLFSPAQRAVGNFVRFTSKVNNYSSAEEWYKWVVDNMATDGTVYGCDPQWDTYMIMEVSDYQSWWQNFKACLEEERAQTNQEVKILQEQIAELKNNITENGCDCSNPVGATCIDLCNQLTEADENLNTLLIKQKLIDDGIAKGDDYMNEVNAETKQTLLNRGAFTGTPAIYTWGEIQMGANLQIPSWILGDPGSNDIFILGGTDTKITTGWKYDSTNDPEEPGQDAVYSNLTHNNAAVLIGTEGKDWTEQSVDDCEIPTAMLDVKGNASDGTEDTRYPFIRFRDLPQYPVGPEDPAPTGNVFADDSGYLWLTDVAGGDLSVAVNGSTIGDAQTLNFLPGTGITIVGSAKGSAVDIEITATGSGGEVNTASNVGSSASAMTGLFKQKSGVDLEFYSLISSDSSVDIDLITGQDVIDLKSTTYTYTADGTNNPNLRLSDGTTDQDIQLVGTGGTTVTHSAGVVTIDSAIGGPGTGTPNFLARWTGTGSTLGDSVIQDDGTRTAINATPETNTAGRMLYIQGDTGGGGIHVTNAGQTSGSSRYTGLEADLSEANLSNTGFFGSAKGATEANVGVIGRASEFDTAGVGVGCYGYFGSFGDVKQSIDYTGKHGVGIAGTTVAEGEIGVLGMVESSQAQNALSQYAIWGQVELTGSNTSIKDEAYVYYSKGVNGNGSGNHSINTAYHLYLEGHSSTVNTNSWGIYQDGANDKNYFAGKVGIGIEPTNVLDIVGSKGSLELLLDNDAGDEYNILSLKGSAADHIQLISIESTAANAKLQAGIIGPANTTGDVGSVNDSFILVSSESNDLNIINNTGTGTTDNIAFYVGKTVGSSLASITPDLFILGNGANKGRVGIGTDTPTEKLEVNGGGRFNGTLNIQTIGTTASVKTLGVDTNGNVVEASGGAGGGSLVPVVKSADYTAAPNDLVLVDSSSVSNMIITLPQPTTNGEVIGVKWAEYTNINDTPTVAGFNGSCTIDGVDRSVATGTPLPLPSLFTYYEFIGYVNGSTYIWFIK